MELLVIGIIAVIALFKKEEKQPENVKNEVEPFNVLNTSPAGIEDLSKKKETNVPPADKTNEEIMEILNIKPQFVVPSQTTGFPNPVLPPTGGRPENTLAPWSIPNNPFNQFY